MRVTASFPLGTLRDTPSEAEIISHQLLLKGGYIRRVNSGIYAYMPLMLRVIDKISAIIEKELENIFGNKIRVKFKTVDIEKSKSEKNTGNNPETSQKDDKVFDKIVDLFDGEIIH